MYTIPQSDLLLNGEGGVYHLALTPDRLRERVILVGDPARVDMIARLLDSVDYRVEHREFRTVAGRFGGKEVMIVSTGISSDCADIVLNELDALANIDLPTRTVRPRLRSLRIVRIGTCGGFGEDIELGDFVATTYAIGGDGLLDYYGDTSAIREPALERAVTQQTEWGGGLPALYAVKTSSELLEGLTQFAKSGATFSAGGFFGAQGRRLRLMPAMPDLVERLRKVEYDGVKLKNMEMEGASVIALARMLGHVAAVVCMVIAHRTQQAASVDYEERMKELALQVLQTI